jgi:hypothetical protein
VVVQLRPSESFIGTEVTFFRKFYWFALLSTPNGGGAGGLACFQCAPTPAPLSGAQLPPLAGKRGSKGRPPATRIRTEVMPHHRQKTCMVAPAHQRLAAGRKGVSANYTYHCETCGLATTYCALRPTTPRATYPLLSDKEFYCACSPGYYEDPTDANEGASGQIAALIKARVAKPRLQGNHRRRQHHGGRLGAWWDLREKRERKGKRGRCVSARRVRLSQQ